jgi:hypothetical protein
MTPFPNLNVLRQNIKFYADHNVTGVFEEGNDNTVSGEFAELRAYLIAKLLWNPYMSEEEYRNHMNNFLWGYYEMAGYYVREYINLLHEQTKDVHFSIFSDPLEVIPPKYTVNKNPLPAPAEVTADVDWLAYADNEQILDMSFVNEAKHLWDTAYVYSWCEYREHIERSRLQVDYYEACLMHLKYGKRLTEQIKKLVPEKDWEKALAFADEQRSALFTKLSTKLREQIMRFGITRLASDQIYRYEGPWNPENEPREYWMEERNWVR